MYYLTLIIHVPRAPIVVLEGLSAWQQSKWFLTSFQRYCYSKNLIEQEHFCFCSTFAEKYFFINDLQYKIVPDQNFLFKFASQIPTIEFTPYELPILISKWRKQQNQFQKNWQNFLKNVNFQKTFLGAILGYLWRSTSFWHQCCFNFI